MTLRGFAAMTPERRREIASKGGKSVPPERRSFSQNRELAQRAGRAGGLAIPNESRSFSQDPKLAQRAGRVGGSAPRTHGKANA